MRLLIQNLSRQFRLKWFMMGCLMAAPFIMAGGQKNELETAMTAVEKNLKKYDSTYYEPYETFQKLAADKELENLDTFMTNSTLKAAFDNMAIVRTKLKKVSLSVDLSIDSKENTKTLEIASRYMKSLGRMYTIYAVAAHNAKPVVTPLFKNQLAAAPTTPKESQINLAAQDATLTYLPQQTAMMDPKFAVSVDYTAGYSFSVLEPLTLVVDLRAGHRLRYLHRFNSKRNPKNPGLVEFGASEEDKHNAELVALSTAKNATDYAKLIKFSTLRESLANRWALNRMQIVPGGSALSAGLTCNNDFMSLNSPSVFLADLDRQDKYRDGFTTLEEKFVEASQKVNFIDSALIETTYLTALQYTADDLSEQAVQARTQAQFIAQTMKSNDEADLKELAPVIVQSSSMEGDDLSPESVAERMTLDFANHREKVYTSLLNSIKTQYTEAGYPEISETLQKSFAPIFADAKQKYSTRLKKKLLEVANQLNNTEFLQKLASARRTAKLNSMVQMAAIGIPAAREIKEIPNDEKMAASITLDTLPGRLKDLKSLFKIHPRHPGDLRYLFYRLIDSENIPGAKELQKFLNRKSEKKSILDTAKVLTDAIASLPESLKKLKSVKLLNTKLDDTSALIRLKGSLVIRHMNYTQQEFAKWALKADTNGNLVDVYANSLLADLDSSDLRVDISTVIEEFFQDLEATFEAATKQYQGKVPPENLLAQLAKAAAKKILAKFPTSGSWAKASAENWNSHLTTSYADAGLNYLEANPKYDTFPYKKFYDQYKTNEASLTKPITTGADLSKFPSKVQLRRQGNDWIADITIQNDGKLPIIIAKVDDRDECRATYDLNPILPKASGKISFKCYQKNPAYISKSPNIYTNMGNTKTTITNSIAFNQLAYQPKVEPTIPLSYQVEFALGMIGLRASQLDKAQDNMMFISTLLHRKYLAEQQIEMALQQEPFLRAPRIHTYYKEEMVTTNYGSGMSSLRTVRHDDKVSLLTQLASEEKYYDSSKGVIEGFDQARINLLLTRLDNELSDAYKNEGTGGPSGSLPESFCKADIRKPNEENFRRLYAAADMQRNTFSGISRNQTYDLELAELTKTRQELMNDRINSAFMWVGFALMGGIILTLTLGSGFLVAGAMTVTMGIFEVVGWGFVIATIPQVPFQWYLAAYERPAQLEFDIAVAKGFVGHTSEDGKGEQATTGITSQANISAAESAVGYARFELGMNVVLNAAFLPWQVTGTKQVLGILAKKSYARLAKQASINSEYALAMGKNVVLKKSFAQLQKEQGFLKAVKERLARSASGMLVNLKVPVMSEIKPITKATLVYDALAGIVEKDLAGFSKQMTSHLDSVASHVGTDGIPKTAYERFAKGSRLLVTGEFYSSLWKSDILPPLAFLRATIRALKGEKGAINPVAHLLQYPTRFQGLMSKLNTLQGKYLIEETQVLSEVQTLVEKVLKAEASSQRFWLGEGLTRSEYLAREIKQIAMKNNGRNGTALVKGLKRLGKDFNNEALILLVKDHYNIQQLISIHTNLEAYAGQNPALAAHYAQYYRSLDTDDIEKMMGEIEQANAAEAEVLYNKIFPRAETEEDILMDLRAYYAKMKLANNPNPGEEVINAAQWSDVPAGAQGLDAEIQNELRTGTQ